MHIVIVNDHLEHHLEVDPHECVFDVKEKWQLLGYPVCKQILSLNGEELTDWIGLKLLDVTKNARLILTINSTQKPFKIRVKILGGEICLEVEEMDTVVSLEDKILDKIGAPHEEQLALFYRGNEMRNDQHLCEYRVRMNSEFIATFEFCGENWPVIEFDEYDIRDGPRSHCRRSEGTPGGHTSHKVTTFSFMEKGSWNTVKASFPRVLKMVIPL